MLTVYEYKIILNIKSFQDLADKFFHLVFNRETVSELLVLSTPDDLLLQLLGKVVEVIAVPRHPDNQVPVPFRVLNSITKGVGRNNIELYVVPIHPEVPPHKVGQAVDALVILQQLWCELLVQKGAAGLEMVDAGGGVKRCCRPFMIGPLEG